MKRSNAPDKMSSPTKRDLLGVAKYAEVFARGPSEGRWHCDPGVIPWLEPTKDIAAFVRAVYMRGISLQFDWPAWQDETDRIESSDDLVATADLEAIRRLITRAVRQDRFCEGALSASFASGRAASVLRRLEKLARAM